MWGEILHTLRLLPHFPLNKWLAAKKLEDTMVSRKNEFGKVGSLSEPPHVLSLNPSQAVPSSADKTYSNVALGCGKQDLPVRHLHHTYGHLEPLLLEGCPEALRQRDCAWQSDTASEVRS